MSWQHCSHVTFLISIVALWLCQMFTSGEAGWKVFPGTLHYFCNSFLNLKLFQHKKLKAQEKKSGLEIWSTGLLVNQCVGEEGKGKKSYTLLCIVTKQDKKTEIHVKTPEYLRKMNCMDNLPWTICVSLSVHTFIRLFVYCKMYFIWQVGVVLLGMISVPNFQKG